MFFCTKKRKAATSLARRDGLRQFPSDLSSCSGSEIPTTGATTANVPASNSTNKRQPLQQQFL
jgi:hypothetical protein